MARTNRYGLGYQPSGAKGKPAGPPPRQGGTLPDIDTTVSVGGKAVASTGHIDDLKAIGIEPKENMGTSHYSGNRPCEQGESPHTQGDWIFWGSGWFKASGVIGVNVNAPHVEVILEGGHTLVSIYDSLDAAYEAREELVSAITAVEHKPHGVVTKVDVTGVRAGKEELRGVMKDEVKGGDLGQY